jgi:glucosylglycerate synthase
MSTLAPVPTLPPDVEGQLEGLAPVELAVSVPTYNNAATLPQVVEAVRAGLEKHFAGVPALLINADAGSSDATTERLADAGLPLIRAQHDVPPAQRGAVPMHGVPGRGAGLRLAFGVARRAGARALVVLEADVTSIDDGWLERLLRPVFEHDADLVVPAYVRHRYDGTITNLMLAPLIGALYGRRVRQPLAGARALSARLLDRLLPDARWPPPGRSMTDLWIEGTALAEGFAVHEAQLGRWRVESNTRPAELPALVGETLGAVFAVMDGYEDLWLDALPGAPLPVAGAPVPPTVEPVRIDVERMVGAFRRGLRDLGTIWEHILAPETWSDVLSLEMDDLERFRFPDELWARVVYDFAVGHHYRVVYRDHLLRSLAPLYLGRTAAFVLASERRDGPAVETALDAVAAAFQWQKAYLVERWR